MLKTKTLNDFEHLLKSEDIIVGYFSHNGCSVCKSLLPKVKVLMKQDFPMAKLVYCDIEQSPELAAQNLVFTAPAIIVFIQEKEYVRYNKNIGLTVLAQSISRPYKMLFES